MANKKPKGGKSKGGGKSQGPKGPTGKRPNQQASQTRWKILAVVTGYDTTSFKHLELMCYAVCVLGCPYASDFYRRIPLCLYCLQNDILKEPQLAPQDRVDAVRPLWESLPQEERVKQLTVDTDALRGKAKQLTETIRQQQGV
jgi:hypothetical protein